MTETMISKLTSSATAAFGAFAAVAMAALPVAAQAQQAQQAQDQAEEAEAADGPLGIPANVVMFEQQDPNVRTATAKVNGAVITGTDVDQRVALVLAASERAQVSAQELHDALVDVQAIYLASLRFLDINFYLPAIIFVIAVVGSQLAIPKRKKSAQPSTKADGLKPAP